ncbi:MAG TPA: NUDIX hydrolase [Spirochaetia bacterium]|nr:NUDIX hydrolase [Spirochaetia bacterium]
MEKSLSSEVHYRGKVLNLRVDEVELPNGNRAQREVVEYPGAVTVVALTGDGDVLLVRQYRHAVGEELLELPAGKLEPGEDPKSSAFRELVEETGFRAREMKLLLSFYTTPGFSTEQMHLFLATGLVPGSPDPDPDEFIAVERVPLGRAKEMIQEGLIRDAKSIVGLLAVEAI